VGSEFDYIFIRITFWFLGFNGLFSSNLYGLINEQGIHFTIINPKFIIDAVHVNNYLGLFLSLVLMVIPPPIIFIFYKNLFSREINSILLVMRDSCFAFSLDFGQVFKIIEHKFSYNKNKGKAGRDKNFTIILCKRLTKY